MHTAPALQKPVGRDQNQHDSTGLGVRDAGQAGLVLTGVQGEGERSWLRAGPAQVVYKMHTKRRIGMQNYVQERAGGVKGMQSS